MYKFFIFLFFALSVKAQPQTPPRTFQSFFREMVSKNNSQLGAFLAEKAALERQQGTFGLYMPALTSSYSQTTLDSPDLENQDRTFNLGLTGTVPQLGLRYNSTIYSDTEVIKPRPVSHQGQFNFTLSLDLLRDFGPRVGFIPFETADLNYSLSQLNKINILYGLFRDLLSSYAGAYFSQKNLDINVDSEKKNQEELRKSMELYKAGKIPKLSLLSLQSQTQQIRSQVIGQERVLRESFRSLYTLASIENHIREIPYDVLLEPIKMPFFDESKIERRLNQKLDFEKLKNPDYRIAKNNLERQKLFLTQAENNIWPSLSFDYTMSGSKDDKSRTALFPRESKGNVIALNFSVPIGLITERHELEASRAEYRSEEYNFLQTKRRLERDWNNLTEQYDLLKKQVAIAKELSEAAKERFEASLPTSSMGPTYQQNVIFFQNEWVNAQVIFNQLQVEYLVTQFQILAFHSDNHIFEIFKKLK